MTDMNSTDNPAFHAPQDTSAHPTPPRDDGDAGAAPDFGPGAFFAPALRGDSEQFPVLKAFQAYVEEERERARRRVVVVSAFSIAAITVLVALFLVALGFMMRRNDQLNDRLLDIVASRSVAPVAPAPVAEASAPPVAQAPAASAQDDGASELQAKLAALEEANAAMVRRMEELQALPDSLAASLGGMISNAVEHALPVVATPVAAPPVPGAAGPSPAPAATPRPPAPAEQPAAQTAAADPSGASSATAQVPPSETTAIQVKPIAQARPTIPGYRTEHILLKTDAGVTIPWRIAVPE